MNNPTDFSQFQVILDTAPAQPALGFPAYAAALADIIEKSTPQFAIGVFGPWGSGKTTLMRLIQQRLQKSKTIAVPFSAWRHEKEQHLIVPLLDCVRDAVVRWVDSEAPAPVKAAALRVATALGQATHALLHGFSLKIGLPNAIEASFEANKALERAARYSEEEQKARVPRSFYAASLRALAEAFDDLRKAGGQRIAVFIDDLDRCLPEGALEVLESMKLFFDIEGFIFVVGVDRQIIERCIDARYAKEYGRPASDDERIAKGADYIKKIFQVPFTLPPVSGFQIDELLTSVVGDQSLPEAQRTDLQNRVRPHLVSITGTAVSPRDLKRFMNAYTIQMKIAPKLDPDVVLALETIRFRAEWSAANVGLVQYREGFLATLKSADARENLAGLDEELAAALPDSFFAYVGQGGAGNALLNVQNVAEYLHGSAVTRSGFGGVLGEVLRDAAQLRLSIKKVDPDKSRALAGDATSIEKRLSSSDFGASNARPVLLAGTVKSLLLAPPAQAEAEKWKANLHSTADQLVHNLAEMYRWLN